MYDINNIHAQALDAYKLGNNDPFCQPREKEFFSATPPGGLAGLKVPIHSSIYPTHTSIGRMQKSPPDRPTPFHLPVRRAAERISPKISKKNMHGLCDFQKSCLTSAGWFV